MDKLLSKLLPVLLFIPKITFLGIYRCLNYGNTEQLFWLNCAEAIFILNVKCSKVAGVEDFAILIFFTSIMHHFSKLTRENLYLQNEKDRKFAKILMSILHRQNKENMRAREQAKDIKRQMKKIGNAPSGGSSQRPNKNTTFAFYIGGGKGKTEELPKEEMHDIPEETNAYPIIELGEDEYRKIDDEDDNNFGGFIEGGNLE